jgi:hypothetical protein
MCMAFLYTGVLHYTRQKRERNCWNQKEKGRCVTRVHITRVHITRVHQAVRNTSTSVAHYFDNMFKHQIQKTSFNLHQRKTSSGYISKKDLRNIPFKTPAICPNAHYCGNRSLKTPNSYSSHISRCNESVKDTCIHDALVQPRSSAIDIPDASPMPFWMSQSYGCPLRTHRN